MKRALSVLLVAALMVLGGLFVASTGQAQTQVECPAGTTLAADGQSCITSAVDDNTTTTTSCTVGVLSADGTQCVVPRLDAAPAPAATTGTAATTAPVPTFTG